MRKEWRDLIPEKIANPTSLEDYGWNACRELIYRKLNLHGEIGFGQEQINEANWEHICKCS